MIRQKLWKSTSNNQIVRINDEIDRGVFDPQTNGSDQKNVIYLVSKEDSARILNLSNNDTTGGLDTLRPIIPKMFTPETEHSHDTLPFVPITNSDIMIREEALTDIEFYRNQLLADSKRLGLEEGFNDEHIEVIRDAVFNHIRNMSSEDVKAFLTKDFEIRKEEIEAFRNREGHQNLTNALDEMNQRIAEVQSLTNEQIRNIKIAVTNRFLLVNTDIIESQSSFVLQNTIRHQIGHELGLEHLIVSNGPWKDRNIMDPYPSQAYNQITMLKEIDPFAVHGVFCLYSEYPIFTQQ